MRENYFIYKLNNSEISKNIFFIKQLLKYIFLYLQMFVTANQIPHFNVFYKFVNGKYLYYVCLIALVKRAYFEFGQILVPNFSFCFGLELNSGSSASSVHCYQTTATTPINLYFIYYILLLMINTQALAIADKIILSM